MKVISKKAISLLLCFVILVSGMVFAMPAAVAEEEPATQYEIKVTIYVEENSCGFENFYEGYYGDNDNSKENDSCGVSVACFGNNGLDSEFMDQIKWDLGARSTTGTNLNRQTGYRYLYARSTGFPAMVCAYCCSDGGTIKLHLQKLEVRAARGSLPNDFTQNVQTDFTTLWEGDIFGWSGWLRRGFGGGVYSDNTFFKWDNGMSQETAGSSWNPLFPHADTLELVSEPETMYIQDNDSVFSAPEYICYDQYGVKIGQPTRKEYSIIGYDYAAYGLSESDIQMSTAGVISKSGETYIAGGSAAHTVRMQASYSFGTKIVGDSVESASASAATDLVFSYPAMPLTWKYKLSTNELNSTEWGSVQSSVLLGNTVTDADYPGDASTREYYTSGNHFKNGVFEDYQVINNTGVMEMITYDEFAHSYDTVSPIDGDDAKHSLCCECGYTVTGPHNFDNGAVTTPATCKETGVLTKTCSDCGYRIQNEIEKIKNHTWDGGVITTAPTCFADGVKTYTCSICGETKTQSVSQLTHEIELKTTALSDDTNGCVYYECKYCHNCWATVYNSESGEYDLVDENMFYDSPVALMSENEHNSNLPAPAFNLFTDVEIGYSYSTRGASLKYAFAKAPYSQPLRFAGSVKVPDGVSFEIGSDNKAVVIDVGYVFSQTEYIENDASRLVVKSGDPKIAQLSIAEKNAENGVFTGHNWGGVTAHEAADGVHLTFNIVIGVDRENWRKEYCVRPYITYKMGDCEVTVYDSEFSSRSVRTVANAVVNSASESENAKAYCQELLYIIGI